jgi:hypothetical protein
MGAGPSYYYSWSAFSIVTEIQAELQRPCLRAFALIASMWVIAAVRESPPGTDGPGDRKSKVRGKLALLIPQRT